MKSRITRSAAAAVIIIGVFIGINMLDGTPAWADVINEIIVAKTATFDLIIKKDGEIIQNSHLTCKAPGLIKQDMLDGNIHIADYVKHRVLILNNNTQKATLREITGDSKQLPNLDIFATFQKRLEKMIHYQDDTVENLDYHTIDGQEVLGFRIQLSEQDKVLSWQGKGTFIVWADSETKLPIRMEWHDEMFGVNTIFDNLELNVELEDSLFDMTIPDGFELKTIQQEGEPDKEAGNLTNIDEKAIIKGFHGWVLLSDGVFPSSMTMDAIKDLDPEASMTFKQVGWGFQLVPSKNIDIDGKRFGISEDNPPSEEETKALRKKLQTAFNNALNGFITVFKLPADSDWHYAGKDVRMGQADTPIFWYRPKDSTLYRIIYGDLTAEDVAPEDLPE